MKTKKYLFITSALMLCFGLSQSFATDDVFPLLQRNDKQVQRLYDENTLTVDLSNTKKEDITFEDKKASQKIKKMRKLEAQKAILKSQQELESASNEITEIMNAENSYAEPQTKHQKEEKNQDCVKYCGEGYFYERLGNKNAGHERICTKYPQNCGHKCTTGWNTRYLVDNTNYTCQEAIQTTNIEYAPYVGPVNAPVVVTEYFDFNCPACRTTAETILELIEANPNVKFVFKPVNFLDSKEAALAAIAADKHDRFINLYKSFSKHPTRINPDVIDNAVRRAHLDVAENRLLRTNTEVQNRFAKINQDVAKNNITAVPTIYINDKVVKSYTKEDLQKAITNAKHK